jgi:DNA-binding HxlR family transcriptional regulator
VGDKWTLLIIRDLAAGPRRFVELQRVLPGISTEQLRSRLNRMVADGLLTRQRYREVPPRVDYELTERARDLLPVIGSVARWGYRWAWGPPRPGEAIDIGAILRCAPGLEVPASLRGTVELVVTRGGQALDSYVLRVGDGAVGYEERSAPEADARIEGPERAWIEAFGLDGSRTELEFSGDVRLAEAVLDDVAALASRQSAAA